MDFEEFCVANGVGENIFLYLKQCYDSKSSVSETIHRKMMDLFRCYIVVGGMPAAVKSFVESKDIGKVISIQKDIVAQYRQDIIKYSPDNKTRIASVFDRIPSELDEKNRRFLLSSINTNARMRDYDDAFMWLADAGVGVFCYNLDEPKIPLKINEKQRLFKLFLSDCGLLCSMGMESIQFDFLKGNISINMGGILENVFADELRSHGFSLRYLNKKKIGEIDFVIQCGSEVIPIEIKSGKDFRSHLSLNKLFSVKEWNIQKGIVFCIDNVTEESSVSYLPWYMIMFLKQVDFENKKIDLDLNFDS